MPSDQFDHLKRSRAGTRAAVTRTTTRLLGRLAGEPISTEDVEVDLDYLVARKTTLQDLDRQILDLASEERYDEELQNVLEYEQQLEAAISRARRALRLASQTVPTAAGSSASPNDAATHRTVSLPKLQISKFGGKLQDWTSYVTEEAKRAIDGISLSGDNYLTAVETLKQRYGRVDLLSAEHIDKLLSLRAVHSSTDVTQLRHLFDEVSRHTRALEALAIPASSYAVVLYRVVTRCLPSDLFVQFRQRRMELAAPSCGATAQGTEPSRSPSAAEVHALLDFLRIQVEAREEAALHRQRHAPRDNEDDVPPLPSAAALPAGISAGQTQTGSARTTGSSAQTFCALCRTVGHATDACAVQITPEEKRRRLGAARRCFRCAKRYHQARHCRSSASLVCGKCNGRHLTVLCDLQPKRGDSGAGAAPPGPTVTPQTQATAASTSATGTFLQTAAAEASGPGGTATVRILLDNGSQRTFVTESLALQLGCPLRGSEGLSIFAFGSTEKSPHRVYDRVSLRVIGLDRSLDVYALAMPQICKSLSPPIDHRITQLLSDRGLRPASALRTSQNVDVLVGADNYWRFVSGNVVRLTEDLTAVETIFGWVVQGCAPSEVSTGAPATTSLLCCACAPALPEPTDMWRLDVLGITDSVSKHDEAEADIEMFERNVACRNGRYEVPLMIQEPGLPLEANNRETAEKRLEAQLQRFRSAPDVLQQYEATMREYFTEEHAEPVSGPSPMRNLYYLPHHAVVRKEAVTTKIRIVFDASSHVPGQPSLNDVLTKGPALNSDLLRLLITLRSFPIILTADIRKAYLQIQIRPEDRDALRFLWFQELPSAANPSPQVQEWRMTRVPFGASSSPFLLAATLHHHFSGVSDRYPDTAARLRASFYVDDLVIGCNGLQEAETLYEETRDIIKEAGMDIRKWASNSATLQERFLKDSVAYDNVGCTDPVLRVLGVAWDKQRDVILATALAVHEFATVNEPTKRTVLKTFSRLYDPFGPFHPFTVTARLLFQTMWKQELPWDNPMDPAMHLVWRKWVNDLPTLEQAHVPRCVTGSDGTVLDLHLFADASPRAYGVAVYVRISTDQGPSSRLLIARARIAPLKLLTLPRLELLGCLLAARIFNRNSDLVPSSTSGATFWTDSQIALQWIRNAQPKCPQFVAGRTREIRQLTDPSQWHHCDGKSNPADLLTRGISAEELIHSELWWTGPAWLTQLGDSSDPLESASFTEENCCPVAVQRCDPLLRLHDYSSLKRAIRVTAYVLRYVNNTRRPQNKLVGPLSAEEVPSAELFWIRQTQREAFHTEISELQQSLPLPRSSPVLALNPYLDEESLLRVGGRLQHLEDSDSVCHPILLPSKHRFTELLVLDIHNRLHHIGVQDTLCELRQKYWVLKGRQAVRRVLHACLQCKRRRLVPETAPVAPLPRERVTPTNPFDVVGIDFAGPLYVSEVRPHKQKAYIVLFTCGVTRAVHLELSSGMSTQHFLTALRRFVSRRGVPSLIMSDNARTFHHAARLLSIIASDDVQDFAAMHRIQWKFIVERAPWWGGWWERMIRSVKDALKRCLGRSLLNFEGLTTALCEVESIVNCRPLTYVTSDTADLNPLTPSDFLVGKRLTALPTLSAAEQSPNAEGLRRYLRSYQQLRSQFWARWRREYLLQLRSAHMGRHDPDSQLKVGDIVVVHDKGPPLLWKLGRIIRVFPGRDGVARACAITLANKTTIHRPVQLMHRLEGDIESPVAREDVT